MAILRIVFVFAFIFGASLLSAQKILSGPMLGYNTMREVSIWVQLTEKGYVQVQFWEEGSDNEIRITETFYVETYKANTATIPVTMLEPGTTYMYKVVVNDNPSEDVFSFTTQKLWHYREEPSDFSFLAGSCVYVNEEKYDRPGKPYGRKYEIFTKMAKEHSDFMIWLGDNTYLREADWNSRSGIYHRYTHTRNLTEMQPLLSKMHHYAIWDDHDYGPNDSDYTFSGKDITREAFIDFWANPNYGANGMGGITGSFVWNDCQFFMLDNRWNRTPASVEGHILGDDQLRWLIDGLRTSKASFKFVCIGGQLVSNFASFENHAVYGSERKKILNLIDEFNIENVVFLTGDRHHSEISKFETEDGQVIWDITSSALTSGTYDHSKEPNHFRYENAIFGENNYAVISISGKRKKRKLTVEFKDSKGNCIKKFKLGK